MSPCDILRDPLSRENAVVLFINIMEDYLKYR